MSRVFIDPDLVAFRAKQRGFSYQAYNGGRDHAVVRNAHDTISYAYDPEHHGDGTVSWRIAKSDDVPDLYAPAAPLTLEEIMAAPDPLYVAGRPRDSVTKNTTAHLVAAATPPAPKPNGKKKTDKR